MEAKTFILSNKKTFRRGVRVFILGTDGKFTDRLLTFTTEHLVDKKLRKKQGRQIAAEYTTSNEEELEALFSDSGYGKDFYLKGDSEGKLKRPTRIVSEKDKQIIALKGLFEMAGLEFNGHLPIDVLKEEYEIHMRAISGRKIEKSTASEIPHERTDVAGSIAEQKDAARKLYEEKYGEPVPEIVKNDVAFLDGMSNPKFDAKAYINKLAEDVKNEDDGELPDDKEALKEAYFKKFNKNVPNMKANDLDWIKKKLEE